MASVVPGGIADDWTSLRANPVFRRTLAPGAIRAVVRSPVVRAVVLTAIMLAVYEKVILALLNPYGAMALVVAFWFLIQAVQHYFCWLELMLLGRSGNLSDYLNSGLSTADVALGVIYPSRIAEGLSVIMIMAWWMYTTNDTSWQIAFLLLICLRIKSMMEPPFLLLADIDMHLRKRGALSLYLIGFSVIVPLVIFFAILLSLVFGISYLATLVKFNLASLGVFFYLGSLFAASYIAEYPNRIWQRWRLRRVLARYASFDDMFEQFVEVGERAGRG
jgi:hypothetical protein